MSVKFYGSTTAGVAPASGSLKKRELAFNSTDGKLWTSTDGTDIVLVASNKGLAWSDTVTYDIGDIVSADGQLWISNTQGLNEDPTTSANWNQAVPESVNVAHDPLVQYSEGDIVISNGQLYVAPVGGATTVPPAGWIAVAKPEVGGASYDAAGAASGHIVYSLGDMVTESGQAYFLSTSPETTPGTFTLSDWTPIGTTPVIGTGWADNTDYLVGNIVSDSGDLWIALNDHTSLTGDNALGEPHQPGQSNWEIATRHEKGGIAWETDIDYKVGDIVTFAGAGYFSIADHISTQFINDVNSWRRISPIEVGGKEWNDHTAYKTGDMIMESGIAYFCNTLHLPTIFSTELGLGYWTPISHGGSEWNNHHGYALGDIVSYQGGVYFCNTEILAPGPFEGYIWPWDTSIWIQLGTGGSSWITDTVYNAGDIITEGAVVYFCNTPHTSDVFSTDSANWTQVGIPEKGGKIYDAATVYDIGDEVTSNGKSYIALTPGSNALPIAPLTTNTNWTNDIIVDPGTYSQSL